MRRPKALERSERSARLFEQRDGERATWFTQAAGPSPPVYGERWLVRDGQGYRAWDPARSKLAGGLRKGWRGDLPQPGERWLYLGAATGTTASHVADLLGPSGRVYALERSPRSFARLLSWAERWPNVLPILGDARRPERYAALVPLVDGIYSDIAQADQVDIALLNAQWYLRGSGKLLLALKTSSMGRAAEGPEHLASASAALERQFELDRPVHLAPYHRAHYLIGGRPRRSFPEEAAAPTRSPSPRAPRRR